MSIKLVNICRVVRTWLVQVFLYHLILNPIQSVFLSPHSQMASRYINPMAIFILPHLLVAFNNDYLFFLGYFLSPWFGMTLPSFNSLALIVLICPLYWLNFLLQLIYGGISQCIGLDTFYSLSVLSPHELTHTHCFNICF